MKRLLYLIVACSFMSSALAQPVEDGKLAEFFKTYLDQQFVQRPTDATALGDHRFDAQLDDISPKAREGWRAFAKKTLAELPKEVAYKKLSRDGQIDYEIFQHQLESQLWLEDNMQPFERDARTYGGYLSDSIYTLLAQSTLPRETNVANAILRMAQMSRIIEEAKRSLTHPAKPILETAIRQNSGAISFYQGDIFKLAGDTAQKDQLAAAASKTVALLKEYQAFLEGPARSRAEDNWRIGRAKFDKKFELETDAGITAEQNLANAKAEFARVQTELYVVARQLWPKYFSKVNLPPDDADGRRETITKIVNAVGQEHGDVANLVSDARATVETIKKFIRERDYLKLPEPDLCQVVEMPEFRRGNSLAYLDNAPPLDPKAASIYAVSPPPADWTPAQIKSFLEEYNSHMLKILTIHEGYPGHYVQLEYANRNPSLIRRVFGSGTYIEGWAVYGEITMLNEGFGDGDLRLRLMQLKFYLRAVANSILDYEMHCTQITDDEAMKFLVQGAYQSEGEAKLKLIRAKQSSVQLSTYFVGRMAHYQLHQAIEREMGDKFSLERYHEAVLTNGSIPPKYLPELVRRNLGLEEKK
jgi:uncharacterized protein (DUF885 family)